MKKILTLLVAVLATASVAHAQFGIIGGFTSSKTSIDTKNISENFKGVSLFHAGIAYKVKLPLGFAIQPALTYEMKGANLEQVKSINEGLSSLSTKAGYIQLGAGIQWGIDLLVARPFLLVQPFFGYQVTGSEKLNVLNSSGEEYNNFFKTAKNKLEYGFELGGGVEVVKHIQVSVVWFKNLGYLYDGDKITDVGAAVIGAYKDTKNYSGIKVSVGIFF
ncbi:MAG: PorT family protein [Bacteroidales bacterium]|nr:PorT family protein [Bacteroidales bacterium]MBQ9702253.1 PorT family protein [Bacteroidales bacterium]MBR1782909.1 PorT family protein [Bacteroidales bacterium]